MQTQDILANFDQPFNDFFNDEKAAGDSGLKQHLATEQIRDSEQDNGGQFR